MNYICYGNIQNGGDDVFFPRVRGFGENVRRFISRLRFLFFFFFFEVEFRSGTLIPLFRSESVHGGSVSWDDCGRVYPDEVRVGSIPDSNYNAWNSCQAFHVLPEQSNPFHDNGFVLFVCLFVCFTTARYIPDMHCISDVLQISRILISICCLLVIPDF